jgi:hypothetical protein
MIETFQEDLVRAGGKELLDAVTAEYRRGWHVQQALVMQRQLSMATACTRLESSAIEGLGYIDSDIPAEAYFYWLNEGRKRGESNIWKHQEFRKEFIRDNPQFKVRYRRKPMTGWQSAGLERAAAEGRARREKQVILC